MKTLHGRLKLGRPNATHVEEQAEELKRYRDRLNRHAEMMHSTIGRSNVTPYQIIGRLVRLRSAGCRPADFTLPDPARWASDQYENLWSFLLDLKAHLTEIANPRSSAWRGTAISTVTPLDVDRIKQVLPPLISQIDALVAATNQLSAQMGLSTSNTLRASSGMGQFAQRLVNAPPMDRASLANQVWSDRRTEIDALVALGREFVKLRDLTNRRFAELAWTTTDVAQTRRNLAAHGRSFFRFFNRGYRDAITTLRGLVKSDVPKELDERLRWFDDLISAQANRAALDNAGPQASLGQTAFGNMWKGSQSDWQALEQVARWEADCRYAQAPENFREITASIDGHEGLSQAIGEISKNLKPVLAGVQEIIKRLEFDPQVGFGTNDLTRVPLEGMRDRLLVWSEHTESLVKWVAYYARWAKLRSIGLEEFAARIDSGLIPADQLLDQFEMAYCEAMYRSACQQHPELGEFSGLSHAQVVERFRQLDQDRLTLGTFRRRASSLQQYANPGRRRG